MPIAFDEQYWRDAGAQCKALYDQANRPLDTGMLVWPGRTAYDIYVTGLTPAASLQKHLAELRAALGLPPVQPPVQLPIETDLHVAPGPLTEARAREVIEATFKEFPELHAVFATLEEAEAAAEKLLRRTIWHLQQAGFQAGRQKNPSGAISKDKFTIQLNGAWHWIDVYTLGTDNKATTLAIQEFKTENAQHVPDTGIAD